MYALQRKLRKLAIASLNFISNDVWQGPHFFWLVSYYSNDQVVYYIFRCLLMKCMQQFKDLFTVRPH